MTADVFRRAGHVVERSPTSRWALRPGWPFAAAFVLYPVWWALGLPLLAFPFSAAMMIIGVARRPVLAAPRWSGLWLLFLAWTVISVVSILDQPSRLFAWIYRDLSYVSAFGMLVAAVTYRRSLDTGRIARGVYLLWVFVVVGGFLGILVPDVGFRSPASYLVPHSLQSNGLISSMLNPTLGATSFVYSVPRPVALFGYTNEWAAALGVLTPFALFSRVHLRSLWAKRLFWVLLVASVVPVVVSVDRGLWVSLGVAVLFVAIQSALSGRLSVLIGLVAGAGLTASVLIYTPLSQVIATRLSFSNLTTRETLVQGAIDSVGQSPVIGYGAPIATDLANTNGLSVGTHGQLWTLLVSHGIPGASLYIAFFVVMLWTLRHVPSQCWWLQAVVVVLLVQLPFYNAVGVPLAVTMVAIALLHREQRRSPRHRRPLAVRPSASPRNLRNTLEGHAT